MEKRNPHIGSDFDDFLSDEGLLEASTALIPVNLAKTDRGILIGSVRKRPTLAERLANTPADADVPGWDANGTVGDELL